MRRQNPLPPGCADQRGRILGQLLFPDEVPRERAEGGQPTRRRRAAVPTVVQHAQEPTDGVHLEPVHRDGRRRTAFPRSHERQELIEVSRVGAQGVGGEIPIVPEEFEEGPDGVPHAHYRGWGAAEACSTGGACSQRSRSARARWLVAI
jgi:hypothetical protein